MKKSHRGGHPYNRDREVGKEIKQNNQGKDLKYEYKVNTNVLIGKLKDSLVLMLLEDDPEKRITMFQKIMKEISKNMVPIRPGRSKDRRKGLRAHKHPVNYKKSL